MSEPFIGEIRLIAFNFAPRGWMFCQGQILAISQYNALFALLGTTYGGNGTTTFALPDLRSRVPVGTGQGPGLSGINWGEVGGAEIAALTLLNMPVHSHGATTNGSSVSVAGTASNPTNAPTATNSVLGASGGGQGNATIWSDALTAPVAATNPVNVNVTIGNSGGSQPFGLRNPYLGMNYAIALEGIFPSRN